MDLLNSRFEISLNSVSPGALDVECQLGDSVNGQQIWIRMEYCVVTASGKAKTGIVHAVVRTEAGDTTIRNGVFIGAEDEGMEIYNLLVSGSFDDGITVLATALTGEDAAWTVRFDNKRIKY